MINDCDEWKCPLEIKRGEFWKSEGSDGKVTKMWDFPAMELMTKGYTDTPWKQKKWNPTKRDLEDDTMIPLYNLQKPWYNSV